MRQAATEYAEDGVVGTDLQMALAAEGYDLATLEDDCEAALRSRPSAEVIPFPNPDEFVG